MKYIFRIYIPILIIFFSCKTLSKNSSIFYNFSDVNIVDFDYSQNKKYFTKRLNLSNDARVIIKQSSNKDTRISFYLESPPLYQTRLNSGVEKIILLYIKEIFKSNLKKYKINLLTDIIIEGNTDFSRFSFSVEKKDIYRILTIFLDSLIIKEWNIDIIKEILQKERDKFINNYKNDNNFFINYSLEKYVFNAHPVFNSFDGNNVSLNLIDSQKIEEYYNTYFSGQRMIIFIYGNVDSSFIYNFNKFENNFNIKDFSKRLYNRFISSRFKLPPYYLSRISSDKRSLLMTFYKAPSFMNDEYFTYLVTLELLRENANFLFPETAEIKFDSMMINITNYGRTTFYASKDNILQKILTFRRLIEFYKNGSGFIFYYDKEKDMIIKDYKSQTDDKIASINIEYVLKKAKNKIFSEYNLSDINSENKEKKYISIYLLMNKEISYLNIKERIESITYDDIVVLSKKIFTNFSWAIVSDEEQLKKISKDFFTL